MFFFSLLSTAEPVLVDFVLDLSGRVGHEDTRVDVRRAHLGLWALQCGEKFGVQECRFGILELLSDITGEAEIWVLIDGTGNQTGDVGHFTEDMRERV